MAREPKNFDNLLGGNAKGLSDLQLKAHFTLYQGYVKKLNEIREKLGTADRGAPNYSFNEFSELKRREPVAYNGTVADFTAIPNSSTTPNPSYDSVLVIQLDPTASLGYSGWLFLHYGRLDDGFGTS